MHTAQTPLPLGVLVSGGGTNLQAILDAIAVGRLPAEIRLVVSNRRDAYGLTRAERHGIPTTALPHCDFSSRQAFEAALIAALRGRGVELVVLAGFLRLLSPVFLQAFPQRIMNIHPSLLPAFPGLHAQRQALERGVRIAGATVHFVDQEMDHGPIISQAAVPVYADDTEASLSARILAQEHRLYPQAIGLYAEGRLEVRGRSVLVHDEVRQPDRPLTAPELA